MAFTNKNLQSNRNNMSFIKGATLFFLGMSCVLLMANAFDIVPVATNAVQYIQKIFLTADGSNYSTTGIILDGSGGNGYFAGTITGTTICFSGDICRTTWPTGGGGGITGAIGTGIVSGWINNGILYLQYTGMAGTGIRTGRVKGATGFLQDGTTTGVVPYWNGSSWIVSGTNIFNTGDNIGMGTITPRAPLEIAKVTDDGYGTNLMLANSNIWTRFLNKAGSSAYNPLVHSNDSTIIYGNIAGVDTASGFVIGPWSAEQKGIRIDSGGYVGIGKAHPTEKLDVSGRGNFDGLCLGNDCIASRSEFVPIFTLDGYGYSYINGNIGIGIESADLTRLLVNGDMDIVQSIYQYGSPAGAGSPPMGTDQCDCDLSSSSMDCNMAGRFDAVYQGSQCYDQDGSSSYTLYSLVSTSTGQSILAVTGLNVSMKNLNLRTTTTGACAGGEIRFVSGDGFRGCTAANTRQKF